MGRGCWFVHGRIPIQCHLYPCGSPTVEIGRTFFSFSYVSIFSRNSQWVLDYADSMASFFSGLNPNPHCNACIYI